MKSNCPPKIVLEGFFLEGKLPDEVEDHVGSCPDCRQKLLQWKEEREAFLQGYPFERLWRGLETRKKGQGFWERFLFPPPLRSALALATIAGLMAFALWHSRQAPEIMSKGGAGLGFYVSHEGQVQRGKSGMSLAAGDDLQFVYSGEGAPFLLLLGVESDGTLTVYYPHGGTSSAPAERGKTNRLPQAIRWQPHSSFERFFALFSKEPIQIEEVKGALKSLSNKPIEETTRLPLPYPQASVLVHRKNGK